MDLVTKCILLIIIIVFVLMLLGIGLSLLEKYRWLTQA